MDPAVLNYLQSQQNNQQQSQGMQPQHGMSQAPYNPFDVGISKAIESARQSLGLTQKQQDKALRSSMLSFADNISQQPKQRGFLNNFASVGRALSPALQTYDAEESVGLNENNQLANQILKYQQADQDRLAGEEQNAWKRQHAEAQLAETRRAHDMMNNRYMGRGLPAETSPLGSNFIPIESKAERLQYTKDKKASGEILKDLSTIQKDYDEFKNISKNDVINPMAPYGLGKAANVGKDFFGYFTGNKALREETSKRKALESKLGKFNLELERKIKGGILSEALVKRFENKELLPSLSDAPDVFEEKLNNLTKEIGERYKASDASLRYGVHISPYDLDELEQTHNGENREMQDMEGSESILMQDANGDTYQIPASEVEGAMQDGLMVVR